MSTPATETPKIKKPLPVFRPGVMVGLPDGRTGKLIRQAADCYPPDSWIIDGIAGTVPEKALNPLED